MTILILIAAINIASALLGVVLIAWMRETDPLYQRLVSVGLISANLLLGGSAVVEYYKWTMFSRVPELLVSVAILAWVIVRLIKTSRKRESDYIPPEL